MSFPYSYFSCPCAEATASDESFATAQRIGQNEGRGGGQEEDKTFDPRSPRSNFSLYPLDHLMWCEDCHDIRCPRCTVEEIVCWYCPSCLFEVPSGMVKSEGNRCTRTCFNCPTCTAPLSVSTLDTETGGGAGPWILACEYCNWTTLDIDIKFDKPTNIHSQMAKSQWPNRSRSRSTRLAQVDEEEESTEEAPISRDPASHYEALKAFYNTALSKTSTSNPLMSPSGEINYNSPSSLARIMSLYTGMGSYGKKAGAKPALMRESTDATEGLNVFDPAVEEATTSKLSQAGWHGTTSLAQQTEQVHPPRFSDGLRPVPTLLRTKRSKRCRACRHILVKPEAKVQSTRYRIKLVAVSYVPSMSLKALPASSSSPALDLQALPVSRPIQFLLTVKNAMFDPVKVTLATPTQTPGRFGSKVTILCPQFGIGANTDVWDEALSGGDNRRSSKLGLKPKTDGDSDARVAEAGKVWEKGRNWTTVVVEVVCASLEIEAGDLDEDEDVLEIPVFVRIEYEADAAADDAGGGSGEKEKREKRELAYWCVLGVGRIARSTVISRA